MLAAALAAKAEALRKELSSLTLNFERRARAAPRRGGAALKGRTVPPKYRDRGQHLVGQGRNGGLAQGRHQAGAKAERFLIDKPKKTKARTGVKKTATATTKKMKRKATRGASNAKSIGKRVRVKPRETVVHENSAPVALTIEPVVSS